jgi:hypothetical protein
LRKIIRKYRNFPLAKQLPQTRLLGRTTGFSSLPEEDFVRLKERSGLRSACPHANSTDIIAGVACTARANVQAANRSLIFDLCQTCLVRQPIPVRETPGEL